MPPFSVLFLGRSSASIASPIFSFFPRWSTIRNATHHYSVVCTGKKNSPKSQHRPHSFPASQHQSLPLCETARLSTSFDMGGGGGGNVDDIWAQLKAKTAPSQHAQRAKQVLRGAQGIDEPASSRSSKSKQLFDLPVATRAGRKNAASAATDAAADASATSSSSAVVFAAATPVAPAFADYDALQTGVARDLNTLADAQGPSSNRLKALQRISGVIDTVSVELVGEVERRRRPPGRRQPCASARAHLCARSHSRAGFSSASGEASRRVPNTVFNFFLTPRLARAV